MRRRFRLPRPMRTVLTAALSIAAAIAVSVVASPTASAESIGVHTCNDGPAGAVCADVRWTVNSLNNRQTLEVRGHGGVQANSGHTLCVTGVALYRGTMRIALFQPQPPVCSKGLHHDIVTPLLDFPCPVQFAASTHVSY